MKNKIVILTLAAIMAMSMAAYATEETEIATDDTTKTQTELVDVKEETSEEESTDIHGYYIANYSQTSAKVNLNIISMPDLLAVSEQAETKVYYFAEDGTVRAYDNGKSIEGTYTAKDGTLTMVLDGTETTSAYEVIDGLLVLHTGDDSSILYDFEVVDTNYITIEDYSTIEIDEANITVTDADVEAYVNSVVQGQTTYEQLTEGTVQDGDIITISFVGVLDGEEEAFEGGTSDGLTIQLGSGVLMDGYEDQLIGQEIGSTVDVKVTFPEDYTAIDGLAGKDATFTTTILHKTVTKTPELTDEWVQEFSEKYMPETFETVEAFKEYSRGYIEEYLLHSAMINAIAEKTSINGYNASIAQMLLTYSANVLADEAAYYGMDIDTYAQALGYDTAAAYEEAQAMNFMNVALIVNKILVDENVTYTQTQLDEALEEYIKLSGYIDTYTLESYKEEAGDAGMWIFTNLEYKYNMALDLIEDRVVLTKQVEEETETEEAAD